jgi:2-methylcitrate dehydratase PrpD
MTLMKEDKMDMGLELAQFVRRISWGELPEDVRDRSRDRLLDALSTAAATVTIGVGPAEAAARTVGGGVGGGGDTTQIGLETGVAAERAAFANGVAVHAILFEDINLKSGDHPGAVVCPAALAAAEEVDASAETLLEAIVAGYEVQLFLGDVCADAVIQRGFRTTSVFGTVGAAAAVAVAYGISDVELENALALAANASFGLPQGWSEGTFEPYLEAGLAAALGLWCVRMAQAGGLAARSTFNGKTGYFNAYAGTASPAEHPLADAWRIREISAKTYPISGTKMTAVDSALELRETTSLDPTQIERVEAIVPENVLHAGGPAMPPFANYIVAQDSAPFLIGAALAGKPMDALPTYFSEFDDPLVAEVASKIVLTPEPGRRLAHVTVRMADGTEHECEVDNQAAQVPSIAAMREKLATLATDLWGGDGVESIADWVSTAGSASTRELGQLLRATGGRG